jgi:hypothetical protein
MSTTTSIPARANGAARAKDASARQGLLNGFRKRKPVIVRAKVRRSECGEAYVRTSRPAADADLGERVFVSEGASMLFWRKRTYRLVW